MDVPPGSLGEAVARLGEQTGVSIGVAGALPNLTSPGTHGRLTARGALDRLLRGTGYSARRVDPRTFRLEIIMPVRHVAALPARLQSNQIVVTATKRDERLWSVPFAATIVGLDAPQLRDRIATTVDIVANTEGLSLTNLGPGRNRVFLRGVADSPFSGPTQSTVGVYLDDARLGFATPDPDLQLIDVDRVEVLRGPQGTLYGTGALGGVYRIVTNKPSVDAGWTGRIGGGGVLTAHGAPTASLDAAVNAPISGSVAARVVGYTQRDGGWIDDRGRGLTDVNTVRISGGRAALRWTPRADWTVDLGAALQRIAVDDGQYAVGGFGRLARATPIAQPSTNDFDEVSLAATGRLGQVTLASTTAYVGRELTSRYDASVPGTGLRVFDERQTERLLSHETRLSETHGDRSWLLGLSVLSTHSNLDGSIAVAGGTPGRVEQLSRAVTEGAVFGEARRTVLKRVDLTLGARLSDTSIRDDAANGGATITRLRPSPTAALLWRPLDGLEVYGRWANAFRPGGLNGATGTKSPTFASDELRSLDLGIRARAPGGVLSGEFNLFDIVWNDVQSDLLQVNGLIATANVGRARILGGDLAVRARWRGSWRLDVATAVQQSELHRTGSTIPGDVEAGLPSAPAFTARLAAGRTLEWRGLTIGADASLRYIGPSRLSFDTALARRMGDYAVLDLDLSAARGAWRLGIGASDLLDTSADTFAFGNPFAVRREMQHTPVRPRSVRLRLERQF